MTDEDFKHLEYAKITLSIIENYAHTLATCKNKGLEFKFNNGICKHNGHRLSILHNSKQESLINLYHQASPSITGYDRRCGGIGNHDKYYLVFDKNKNKSYFDIEVNDKFKPFTLTEEEHFQYSLIYDLKSFEYYKLWSELLSSYTIPDDYTAYWFYFDEFSLDDLHTIDVNMKSYRESIDARYIG